jgi:hypothetical protein
MKRQLTAAVSVMMMMMGVACGEGVEQPSSPESSGAPELAQQESGLSTTSKYAIQSVCGGQMVGQRIGGGVTTAALETHRYWIKSWEKFRLQDMGGGWYVLKTASNNSVTVENGGGLSAANEAIRTNTTETGAWETLYLAPQGGNVYALRTVNGYYLSAVNCGGISGSGAFASDRTSIGPWEKFRFIEVE